MHKAVVLFLRGDVGRNSRILIFLSVFAMSFVVLAASEVDDYYRARDLALEHPDNLQAQFDFAKVATSLADYRGAIAALERILTKKPDLANIRLELGILYKKVGAYDLAEAYITEAIKDPDIPENVKQRAQVLLVQAEDANTSHSFSHFISIAALYDDNANAGPSDRSIVLNDIEAVLSEDSLASEDTSLEVIWAGRYKYDIKNQGENAVEVDVLSYNRAYDKLSRLDTNLLSLKLGTRINLGEQKKSAHSVKPYVGVNHLYLDGDKYKEGKEIGVHYQQPIQKKTLSEFDIKVEDQDYSNSQERPNAALRSGTLYRASGRLTHKMTTQSEVFGELVFSRRDSEEAFESLDEVGGGVGYSYRHSSNENDQLSPVTSLALEWRNVIYDEADTVSGFNDPREEQRYVIRLSNTIPMNENTAFNSAISYTDNQSDIALYDYDNWGASVGISYVTY